jgi:hypothetical protein
MTDDETLALKQLRRRQRDAVEQITTDTRLRDGLTDDQATILLDWALNQIETRSYATAVMPDGEAETFMDALVTAVSHTTRRANQLIAHLPQLDEAEAAYQVDQFLASLVELTAVPANAQSNLLSSERNLWDKTAVFHHITRILANEEEE